MPPVNREQIEKLEGTIAELEAQRGTLSDDVIDTSVAALRNQIAELSAQDERAVQQRKLVTLLFVDVVGSTGKIAAHLDPEDTLEIMDSALKRLAVPVENHGGHVTRFMGDGFKAIFGAPTAQEDDPERAVRAGLNILEAAGTIDEELADQWEIRGFQVRVGINTGLVALGGMTEAEDTVMGKAVNLAARLESAVPPGGLLISHDTYRHVRGVFDVEPQKSIRAKGFDEPVQVYRVLGAKPRAFRLYTRGVEGVETRMVGREAELKHLQDALLNAIEEGEGQVITISGEAGVGKSRLLYEFQNWIELLPHQVKLFMGRASQETQNLPYGLLRDLFSTEYQIKESSSPGMVREKLESGFGELFGAAEDGHMRAHIIGQLLGFDFSISPHLKGLLGEGQQLRDRGLNYIVEYFQAVAYQGVCVVFLDDIHWGDDSSLDVIDHLGHEMQNQPLVILCLGRGRLFERRPFWGEGQTYHARIELRPLSRREGRQLVSEILKMTENVPHDLRELIVEGAEGNPYYIEELIKMLIEKGVILKGEERWLIEKSRLAQMVVPSTLMGVLQARLDGLPLQERTTLQRASVIGRVFWDNTVEHISWSIKEGQEGDGISSALYALRKKEMVYRREASAFAGTREYMFKHTVLRDVTYESVLKRLRRSYHGMVAEWLIEHAGERVNEYTGLIAEHLDLAGQVGQAVIYLCQAGDQAIGQYANEEAICYYRRALALIAEHPADEEPVEEITPQLHESLGDVYSAIGRHQNARDHFQSASSMVSPEKTFWCARLQRKIGDTWRDQGKFEESDQAYHQSESILGPMPEASPSDWWQEWVWIQINRLLGYYARAQADKIAELVDKLQPVVEQYGSPQQHNAFYSSQAKMYFRSDRYVVSDELLTVSCKLLDNALEIGEVQRIGEARFENGFTLLWYGDLESAEDELHESLRLAEQCSNLYNQTLCLTYLTILYRRRGQVEQVKSYIDRSIEVAERRRMINYVATAKANQAWVSLREGDLSEAERKAEAALDLWEQIPYIYPFQWTALWPLLAFAVEQNQLDQAVEYGRRLLKPEQQRLPDGVVAALDDAIKASERNQAEIARQKLEEALERAAEIGHL
jgi:class 3 adenylate cyclase/tetratricopeptide (TPR) repeat protein